VFWLTKATAASAHGSARPVVCFLAARLWATAGGDSALKVSVVAGKRLRTKRAGSGTRPSRHRRDIAQGWNWSGERRTDADPDMSCPSPAMAVNQGQASESRWCETRDGGAAHYSKNKTERAGPCSRQAQFPCLTGDREGTGMSLPTFARGSVRDGTGLKPAALAFGSQCSSQRPLQGSFLHRHTRGSHGGIVLWPCILKA